MMRAGTALQNLPLKRPHPTFVETTLPHYGRLVKVPAFVEMQFEYEVRGKQIQAGSCKTLVGAIDERES
jgi:hypothetical protein